MRIIIRKYINFLPFKFVEFLIIMEPITLKKAIELALDIKVSQKVKTIRPT